MQKVTKLLLLDYHAGRAMPLQVKLIESWLADPRNEPLFYQTLFEWELEHPQYIADLPNGLERYRRAMDSSGRPEGPTGAVDAPNGPVRTHPAMVQAAPDRRLFSNWLVAASVAGVLLLAGWLLREPVLYKTYATTYGELSSLQLPDGSRVTLNANSTLRYPRFTFGHQQRDVFLSGEAEFSVIHTKNHQRFVVHTNRNLNVEVLGTRFVVLARERATRVVLTKGRVKLQYTQTNQPPQELIMRPGEQATLDESLARVGPSDRPDKSAAGESTASGIGGKLTIQQVPKPAEFSAWTEHRFVFNDTPLREIGDMIRDNYGLDVSIRGDELAKRMVSGTFEAANADELLDVLKELLIIDVVRQRNRVILSELNTTEKPSK